MKTKLVINEDLQKYLYEELNRLTEDEKKLLEIVGKDPFNWQWNFKFDNNYGASVIKFFGSYGFDDDLFELAVTYFDGDKYELCYDTEITEGVIGYLSNDEVMEILYKIKSLKGECKNEN